MNHIDLNSEREAVKEFFLSLPADPHGSLIELNGRVLARVTPVDDTAESPAESAEAEPTLECKWSRARRKIRAAARGYSEETHADY